jgi:sec-independent protein translocase protein TatC
MVLHTLPIRRRSKRPNPAAMTLGEHLRELRRRVFTTLAALMIGTVVAFVCYPEILHALQTPYCHVSPHCALYVTGPLDGLSLRIKVGTYGALVLASPVVLWELWRFVTPGLEPGEKRYAVPFVGASLVLFVLGVVAATLTFPHALRFLSSVGGPTLQQIYSPGNYLALILGLVLVFGIAFEFPVLLVALQLAGVVSYKSLVRWRRWAVVGIVSVAAVITPSGDPLSMMVLAVPLVAFYELSIVLGRLLCR